MGWQHTAAALGVVFAHSATPAAAWSLSDEIQVIDLNLTAAIVWEVPGATAYCNARPPGMVHFRGQCFTATCQASGDTSEHLGLLRIDGLPSLIEIANSFTPTGALTFGVPVHPEGLPAGERFDVYVGAAGTLADLSLAQPLACDVAAGADPGARVTVTDSLPPPAPGEARYYLTAVMGAGLRRAGSARLDGTNHGRDADLLPPCVPPF